MVTIKFDDPNLAANARAILELQKAGISDKVIQDFYDQEYNKSKTKDVDTELHLPGEIMTGEEIKAIYISAMDYAIEAIKFAEFTGKMLFDDWETDCKDLYPELACRRLVKLGIVELSNGVYSLKESEEEVNNGQPDSSSDRSDS